MAKIIKQYWLVIIVLIISFSLRFYNISEVPYALDGDEAAFGYYGYSLLHNLSDEYGNKVPLYFASIGDYKYPIYAYLSVIPVAIFGLNEFSTRFFSAFLGSLFPLLIFLLAKQIFNNKKVAYISLVISTISPIGILFSRGAYESNVGLFFATLGILLLTKYSYLSIIPFILSILSYSANRVYIPLFLFVYTLLTKNKKILAIACILVAVVGIAFLDKRSLVRADDIGFRQNGYLLHNVERGIWDDGIVLNGKNIIFTRLFNNKIFVFAKSFGERYFEHLNPTYLFFEGNPNMPKYSIQGMGLFYYFEIITILVGFYGLSKVKNKNRFVPLIIILASIIPSSLTIETPNPIRMLSGLSGWILLSGFGAFTILENLRKRKTLGYMFFTFLIFVHLTYFIHQYFITHVVHDPWYSDGGVKEMVQAIQDLQGNYKNVVLTGDPYIFFLFYNKVNPDDFINSSKILPETLGAWSRVDRFGKLVFKMPYDCPKIGQANVIYVCKGGNIPINSKLLKSIKFKDGNVAFNLIEFIPLSESKKDKLPEKVHYMTESDSNFEEGLLPDSLDRFW